MPERIRARSRWRDWAAALLSRRRRLASRLAGLGSILAKPRTAGRTLRELRLLSSRNLGLQKINLAIQPLLRFELRPASPLVSRITDRNTDRVTDRSADRLFVERFRSFATAGSAAAAKAPLALVVQRLREPERRRALPRVHRHSDGPAARPELVRQLADRVRRVESQVPVPVIRVVARESAPAAASRREPASPWDPAPSAPAAPPAFPDRWHTMPAAAPAPPPPVDVEAVADRVMQQIDRRLHAWRERRGGF